MSTQIFITPPGGTTEEIKIYDKCTTKQSTTNKAGQFSLILPAFDKSLIDKYPLGSDLRVVQEDSVFRGWVLNPKPTRDGKKYSLQIEGMSYSGRIQKVYVTESYENQKISDIVIDLFSKYAPQYNLDNIVQCDKIISIKFKGVFLFDAMEQLAEYVDYEWFIDEPVPEEIDTHSSPAGWIELVETTIHKVHYPSNLLYPNNSLYPC